MALPMGVGGSQARPLGGTQARPVGGTAPLPPPAPPPPPPGWTGAVAAPGTARVVGNAVPSNGFLPGGSDEQMALWRQTSGAGGGMSAGAGNGMFATGTRPTTGGVYDTPPVNTTPPGEGFGPGFGETYGKEHIGALDAPTALETFANQQLAGNNPYYDRLRQQGAANINQQMAARGHFNSGGAMAALGNFEGAQNAAQFADMGNLLNNAGSMGLRRQDQGFAQATGIQQLGMGRQAQQFNQLSDLSHLGAGLTQAAYGAGGQQSGDAAMNAINAGANQGAIQGQTQDAQSGFARQIAMMGIGGMGGAGGKAGGSASIPFYGQGGTGAAAQDQLMKPSF